MSKELNEYRDVREFGVKADGVTDDTEAFQRAVDFSSLEAENKALRADIERYVSEGIKLADQRDALRSMVVVVPDYMEDDGLDTSWTNGWNSCVAELARLNGKTVSEADLRKWLELMEHGDFREGYCMCGSAVDSHGIYDGHAPTDAGEYYAGQVMEELRALLDAGKEDGNG